MPSPERLIQSHSEQVTAVRERVAEFVGQVWDNLPDYRGDDVERFVSQVLPVVAGGQRQVAALTNEYLARMYAEMTGQAVDPGGVPSAVTGATVRAGTELAEVYRRPFESVWTALSNGEAFPDARQRGKRTARRMAATDLQLSKTHAAQSWMKGRTGVVGYRRVLEGVESCGMCVVASTQRYHTGQLMPIHQNCDCGVAPIIGDRDPGQAINAPLAASADAAMRKRFKTEDRDSLKPSDYRRALFVREHGELGPVLSVK